MHSGASHLHNFLIGLYTRYTMVGYRFNKAIPTPRRAMQIGVIFTRLADIEIYNHHLYMLFFSLSPSSIFLLSFLPYSSFSPYFLPTSPILSFPLLSPPPFFSPFILGFVPFSLPSTPYFKYKSSHFFPPFSIRKKYLSSSF